MACKQLNQQTTLTTEVKPSVNRGTVWSDKEVKSLVAMWGESNVQEELDGAVRNRAIYQQEQKGIAKQQGCEHDWKQCRAKLKNLKTNYKRS